MLDEIAEVVKRDPSQLLNPKSDFRNKLHEFRTWQNEYTKRKLCSFCMKKLKLKDKMISTTRESARREKYNGHEYIKRLLSMTA